MVHVTAAQTSITKIIERQYERNISMTLFLGDVASSWYNKLLVVQKTYNLSMLKSPNTASLERKLHIVLHCLRSLRKVLMEEYAYEKKVSSRTYRNVPLPLLQDLPRMVELLHNNYFTFLEKCRHHVRVVQFAEQCLLESELPLAKNTHRHTGINNVASRKNLPLNKINTDLNVKIVPSKEHTPCDKKNHAPLKRNSDLKQGQGLLLPLSKKRRCANPNSHQA